MTDESGEGNGPAPLVSPGELKAAALIVLGAFAIIAGVLIFVGPTGEDIPSPPSTDTPAAGSPTPTRGAFPVQPANPDEEAIHELARLSIDLLPQGDWPDLYDRFIASFPERCAREAFTQAGIDAANDLGDSISLLAFKGLSELSVEKDTARAVIVGELRGQSEYEVEAYFRREDGTWKIEPAPGTEGCNAFNRLSA
jgi:hypothetical protein